MPFRTALRISRAAMREQPPATARSLARALGEMPGPESQPILINAGRERPKLTASPILPSPPYRSHQGDQKLEIPESRAAVGNDFSRNSGLLLRWRIPGWLGAAFAAGSAVGALAAAETAMEIPRKIKFLLVIVAARVLCSANLACSPTEN